MLELNLRGAGTVQDRDGWPDVARRRIESRDARRSPLRAIHVGPAGSLIKRSLDIVGAVLFLVALAPVMLVLCLLVRLDGGPALFAHTRIGANGRTFGCLKFRSMCIDAEKRLHEVLEHDPAARAEWERDYKLRNDPRITAVGRFLRQTSLDELPQLINVLIGDMSLVGPRPIVRGEISRYGTAIQEYLRCRPGITGLWQTSGRNDANYDKRVELDTHYARSWSFKQDIVILFRTVSVVLKRSGAY
jgi:Undecaprenyl-phosphate galactose phosphotransferase WbaP